jgi:thiamine pyrophosphokinase
LEESVTSKIEEIFEGLEYMCFLGPMETSFTHKSKYQAYICVDGGAHLKDSLPSHAPCLTVGDGDSYDKTLDVTYPEKKDLSDFSLALKILPKSIKELDLYGIRNGRKDHEIINIGEILNYLDINSHLKIATIINDDQDTWYALNKGIHTLDFKSLFSIITLQKQKVTITGNALYKGFDITFNILSSHGLSNQANGSFTIECQKPLLVMKSHEVASE